MNPFRRASLALLLVLPAAVQAQPDETLLLRYPDLHGDQVVFTHGGDLWLASDQGGTARRLTSHPGLELFAHFSPNGDWIAFTGQYGGDEQVYVVPAAGGEPRQLTWYPSSGPLPPRWGYDHQVHGWTPDGTGVVFRSLRDARDSSEGQLFVVSLNGGLPEALPMPQAGSGVYAGEDALFYTPLARDFRTWKRYEGGWAQDLWMFDLASGQARRLTDDPGTDRDPMWIDGTGYFASDRGTAGKLNLYRIDPGSGEVQAVTEHADWDVRWPADDGQGRIVYTHGGALRIVDVRSGDDRRLAIRVPDDGVNRRVRTESVADQVGDAVLSPTGERVLFYARGDLFNAPVEQGVTRAVTRSSDAHDREPAWAPDGQTIAWVSDAGGEEALWIGSADGTGEPRRLGGPEQARLYSPRFAPDGERIAYSDHLGRIWVQEVDGGDPVEAGRDPSWRNRDYEWSPSGRYLAFSQTQPNQLRALYVFDTRNGSTRRISEGLYSEYEPVFSPDGAHLFFLADREFAPQISGREWNFATNRVTGVLAYALTDDAANPFAPKDASDDGILGGDDENGDSDGGEQDKNEERDVVIEFDGLAERVIRVPVDASNYADLWSVEGALLLAETDPFYYGRGWAEAPRLKRFDFEDRKTSTFVEGLSGGDLSADRKVVMTRHGNDWQVRPVTNGKDAETVDRSGLVAEIDPVAEWATAFDETWRRFRDFFYVENMHGYDWDAIGDRYRQLLPHVAHRVDLNDLIGEMIAELNVSHAYVSGGDLGLPDRPDVALLGARLTRDGDRYRISDIFDGQNDEARYRAPLTEAGVEIGEGDYLLAINGQPLTADTNPYRLLTGKSAGPLALTVSGRADGRNARDVLVRPIDDEQPLHYLAWVRANKAEVEAASDGRLGYLHLPDMGPDGIREFIKWYYGQIDREGLIIDVRGNGGGNVSQMIIERLARKPLSLGYSRTMPQATNYPNQAFRGHLVSLLNENSASDGDIFPYQFRNAGLGPLIGKRSWGGVVGITNHGPLIDGGSVNVPEFGFLNTEGEYVIEGEGVSPDIEVDNDPASVLAGRDRQLEAGVAYLLERIQRDPVAAPPRPAPPVKTP